MLNLREFRSDAHRLADWLPWACLIAPGIVLNKDGTAERSKTAQKILALLHEQLK